ncbi:hypothetical protein [Neobacillus sp.]|uniref:hypothetical protein n=1 Tax=Neobacillus sp. TaxID=2675273 RepID=UPI00289D9526|nr:hypothetical protein [Neobacillus sp.]
MVERDDTKFIFIFLSISFICLCGLGLFVLNLSTQMWASEAGDKADKLVVEMERREKAEREETLKKGIDIDIDALIVDKSKESHSSTSLMPVIIGGTTYPIATPEIDNSYYLKIYAEDKNYDIAVPKNLYDKKQIGTHIEIKLYNNRIEVL